LVSDIPAGDGKMANSFLQCSIFIHYTACTEQIKHLYADNPRDV
jgi:hypothetical protein